MKRLIDLIRRRHLAYDLLEEYDREPIDYDEALRRLQAYVDTGSWGVELRPAGVSSWSQAVKTKAQANAD